MNIFAFPILCAHESAQIGADMRLLVAEDQKDLNEIITKTLTKNHYTVDSCYDGQEALDYLDMAEYDGAILDIMMPRISGLDVVKTLRASGSRLPILLLTARDSIQDRVLGLDSGADDYLIKPFAFEELLARIRAMLRKKEGRAQNRCQIANLTVDFDSRTVMRGHVPITLSSKEFSILEYLVNNQGIVLSRERIEQHIWNYDYEGGSNVVDVYIRYLRKKIDEGFEPKLIHTVRGVGYKMGGEGA